MAITRATGKAYRLGFSWIMTLAGYEATPAEEMDGVIDAEVREIKPTQQANPLKDAAEKSNGDAPPTEKALAEWADLLKQAEAKGLNVPPLPENVTTAQLRAIYAEVRDQVRTAQPA